MNTVQEEFEFQGQESKSRRSPKTKYVPVYHVELVRDRSIKVAPPTTIQSVANVAAILRDELDPRWTGVRRAGRWGGRWLHVY